MIIERPSGEVVNDVAKAWEQEKAKKEKEIYETISKIFREAIDKNLLTDRVTESGTTPANQWNIEITDQHCGALCPKIMEPLVWLGLTVKSKESILVKDEDMTLYKYNFTILIEPSHECDPEKKAELKRRGWDWNKYEKSKLLERIKRKAHDEYRKLIKSVKGELTQYPLYETWQVPINQPSRRVLDWVIDDFANNGFTCSETIGQLELKRSLPISDSYRL